MISWLQFVPISDFVHYLARGWRIADDLGGTPHGAWSVLMERDDAP